MFLQFDVVMWASKLNASQYRRTQPHFIGGAYRSSGGAQRRHRGDRASIVAAIAKLHSGTVTLHAAKPGLDASIAVPIN